MDKFKKLRQKLEKIGRPHDDLGNRINRDDKICVWQPQMMKWLETNEPAVYWPKSSEMIRMNAELYGEDYVEVQDVKDKYESEKGRDFDWSLVEHLRGK